MNKYLKLALEEGYRGIKQEEGGPFGAVIVRKGKVVAKAHNTVLKTNDPTAHAEINAIRIASKKLKTHDLSDCELYATSKPCPMCFSAIHWARIDKVYFGTNDKDVENIGFDDRRIYDILNGKIRHKGYKNINRKECLKLLNGWDGQLY